MEDWSKEEEKAFENALANNPENWDEVVANITGKSIEEIKRHYVNLIDDVKRIESGIVPLPAYKYASPSRSSSSVVNKERRKGTPWSTDEHKLFLEGVEKHGWGDWRSISRNCVVTRTPTQVASHAQKYNLRQASTDKKKKRKRSSIHDITRVQNRHISAPTPSSAGAGQSPLPSPPTC